MKTLYRKESEEDEAHFSRTLEYLKTFFTLSERDSISHLEWYYDTFDWRVYQEKNILKRVGDTYQLLDFAGQMLCEGAGHRRGTIFCCDIKQSPIFTPLEKIVGSRAALLLCSIKHSGRRYALLNKDQKVVVQISLQQGVVQRGKEKKRLPAAVLIEPFRGYEKPFKKTIKLLEENGFHALPAGMPDIYPALKLIGLPPLSYTSKFSLKLNKNESVNQSFSSISKTLTTSLGQNYSGVLKDIDVEFLHDFRIAIRRIRTLLSLFKNYLPEKERQYFQKEFSWLGGVAGSVRDLDVYLETNEKYRAILPPFLQEGIDFFFENLLIDRGMAFRTLQNELKSKRYKALLINWTTFYEKLVEKEHNVAGEIDSLQIIQKMGRKQLKKIVTNGGKIRESSPDEELHELRINCKKYRYLLEFYKSYFEETEINAFLRQMKKLQDNLGAFNDLTVQQQMLKEYQINQRSTSKKALQIAASLGGLLLHFSEEQRIVRDSFSKKFEKFRQPENLQLMKNLPKR